jgi:transposase-like protein
VSGHAPPFYCPYCGDEDLRPFGERHGDWRCGACRRVFTLRYQGLARPAGPVDGSAAEPVDGSVAGIVAEVDGLSRT